jgi:hypothetical protein
MGPTMEPTTALSPTRYFWLQLAVLTAGFGVLVVVHEITRRMHDGPTSPTLVMAAVVMVSVSASLVAVARSTYVIVTAAFSDAHRVFRSRHLLLCAVLLLAVTAIGAGTVIVHDPFDKLFAHGRITGEDITDVGIVLAAVVCGVGAGVALTGAWDTLHEERHWYRSVHLRGHRRI